MAIELVSWRTEWARDFEALRVRLGDGFGELAVAIDHIGSTSVPGLAAKDVIDVQVIVRSLAPTDPIAAACAKADMDELFSDWDDHIPPGWHGDQAAWNKMFTRPRDGDRRANIHIRVAGSPNERYALLFRDFLRADDRLRDAWGTFKRAVAAHADDIDAYLDVKDPATDVVMVSAERWAADTGWHVTRDDA